MSTYSIIKLPWILLNGAYIMYEELNHGLIWYTVHMYSMMYDFGYSCGTGSQVGDDATEGPAYRCWESDSWAWEGFLSTVVTVPRWGRKYIAVSKISDNSGGGGKVLSTNSNTDNEADVEEGGKCTPPFSSPSAGSASNTNTNKKSSLTSLVSSAPERTQWSTALSEKDWLCMAWNRWCWYS